MILLLASAGTRQCPNGCPLPGSSWTCACHWLLPVPSGIKPSPHCAALTEMSCPADRAMLLQVGLSTCLTSSLLPARDHPVSKRKIMRHNKANIMNANS